MVRASSGQSQAWSPGVRNNGPLRGGKNGKTLVVTNENTDAQIRPSLTIPEPADKFALNNHSEKPVSTRLKKPVSIALNFRQASAQFF
jgi:hypothetical protein